jgi:hypothetical protein
MLNQNQIYKIVEPLFEREFDPQETLRILSQDRMKYWSWGVSKKINYLNKGLLMKVSGNHHKGLVLITLGWEDLHKVYIISNKGEVIETYEGLYFDQLTEVIDNRIERIPEYHR